MTQFFDHSNRAKDLADTVGKGDLWAYIKNSFEACPPGKSFAVPADKVVSDSAIRSLVSRRAKSAGKTFRVLRHEGGTYEIARFDDERKIIGHAPAEERRDESSRCQECGVMTCNGECMENI